MTLAIIAPAAPADQRIDEAVLALVKGREPNNAATRHRCELELVHARVAELRIGIERTSWAFGAYA